MLYSVGNSGFCNFYRVGLTHLKYGDVQLLAHNLQLLDGGGTVDIAGGQKGPLAVLAFHQSGQFGAVRGFTCALKTHHHHHRGGLGCDLQLGGGAAHQISQLLVDDLNDHLGRGEGL